MPEVTEHVKKGAFLKFRGVTTIDRFDSELTVGSISGIKKIADFYGLETEADYQDFLDTFCTNEFINHYNSVENPESDN